MDNRLFDSLSFENVIYKLQGVAGLCSSISLAVDAGTGKYDAAEMNLLCDIVESAIRELRAISLA